MPSEWEGTLEAVRERQDLSTRWIAGVAAGTVLFLALCLGGLWLFYAALGQPRPQLSKTPFPRPELQSDPRGDLRTWRAAQEEQLNLYAWVDREHGIAQIPIARAMQVVVARGDKAYDPPAASP